MIEVTNENYQDILDQTALGEPLKAILAQPGMPDQFTLQKHLRDNPDLHKSYKKAKVDQRAMLAKDPVIRDRVFKKRRKLIKERRNARVKAN